MKFKYLLPILLVSSKSFAFDPTTSVVSQARSSSCIRNNECIVATGHWAEVRNSNKGPRIVYVTYKICPQNEECMFDTYKIKVNNGTWHDGKIMTTMAKYHYNGDFTLSAETTLSDEHRNVINTTKTTGIIQVHD